MSRISSIPTASLWGLGHELWIKALDADDIREPLINYYEKGIIMVEAKNKDIVGTHSMGEIMELGLMAGIQERQSLVSFYKTRLKELKL